MTTSARQPIDLPVSGMTCASCAGRVERALGKLPGVQTASVNLAAERVRIESLDTPLPQLIQAIEAAGYQVPQQTLELSIGGMTCASCVGRIERALGKADGVISVSVNLASEKARLRVLADTRTAGLIKAVAEAGCPLTQLMGNRMRSGANASGCCVRCC